MEDARSRRSEAMDWSFTRGLPTDIASPKVCSAPFLQASLVVEGLDDPSRDFQEAKTLRGAFGRVAQDRYLPAFWPARDLPRCG
jgi:hypothetical protein